MRIKYMTDEGVAENCIIQTAANKKKIDILLTKYKVVNDRSKSNQTGDSLLASFGRYVCRVNRQSTQNTPIKVLE